jgi:hypothetical protein
MKRFALLLAMSASLIQGSYAQNLPMSDAQKAEIAKKEAEEKANDEAYKSQIGHIPDAKQKADPWGSMRAPSASGNK